MRSCPACGATAPPEARWCGQCYASFGGGYAGSAASQTATVNRFGIAVAPAPTAPPSSPAPVAPPASPYAAPPTPYVPAPTPPSAPVSPWPTTSDRPMPPVAPPPVRRDDTGRMHGPRAVALTAIAIGIGAVGMGLSWKLGRDESIEPETYIRYALVITLTVYALVGALVVTQLAPGLRLRWRSGGSTAGAIAFGVVVGGGLSAALLGIVSAASGHLAPDPRIVVLMSEGDLPHIIVTVALTCVCAPLVEEVLFRGLLLESLRERNTSTALVVSGAAFAVWHLTPSALRYYAIMGLLLGGLYVRRGLVCSMAAHAAFNGVLTVAALAVVLSPAKAVTVGHVTFGAPGGWTKVADATSAAPFAFGAESASALELTGPSGAMLAVLDRTFVAGQTPTELTQRIQDGQLAADYPGLSVDVASTRQVRLPAGPTVEVDVSIEGHRGTIAYLVLPTETVKFMFFSGGSMKAQSDFGRILDSVQVA